jgi:hypothetical protein
MHVCLLKEDWLKRVYLKKGVSENTPFAAESHPKMRLPPWIHKQDQGPSPPAWPAGLLILVLSAY